MSPGKYPLKFLLIRGSKSKEKTNKYIISAAKKQFDTVLSVPLSGIRVDCSGERPKLFYKDKDLTVFHACYPRFFGEDFVYGSTVLEVLEANDIYMPTSSEAYQITNHKYYTVKRLGAIGAPIPKTTLCVGQEPAVKLMKKVGYPAVVKLISGFGGRGVMLVNNESDFKPLLDTLRVFKEFLSAQEFVDVKGGDMRCYVIGKRILAVKRKPPKGEWRTNVSRGARAVKVRFPSAYKKMVLDTAALLNFEVGAVDLLETKKGPFIIEVNFCPGLMVEIFGKDLANIFVPYIYKKAKEHHYGE